jgi:hypothetical protein
MHIDYARAKRVERRTAEINLKVMEVEEKSLVLNKHEKINKQQLDEYQSLQANNEERAAQLGAMSNLQW